MYIQTEITRTSPILIKLQRFVIYEIFELSMICYIVEVLDILGTEEKV